MAGAGDQVLPTSNTPNGTAAPYPSPPNPLSIGTTVDMGPTQASTQRQFSLAGTPGVDVVDVNDSQTGLAGSWTFVERLNGGDRNVILEVGRFLRTVRQQGSAAVVCEVGDLVPPGTASPGAFWDVGGNATGPLTGGTQDGSGVAIGAGLAGGVIPTAAPGKFIVNAQTESQLQTAGVTQLVANAGGLTLWGGGTHGVAIGAGASPVPTDKFILMQTAPTGGVSIGAGTAPVGPLPGDFLVTAAASIALLAAVNTAVYSLPGGQVNIGSESPPYPPIADSIQLITINDGPYSLKVAGNGTITETTNAGGYSIGVGGAAPSPSAGAFQVSASGEILLVGGSGGASVDAAGAVTIGGTSATSLVMGNVTGAFSARVNVGSGGLGVNTAADPSALADFNGSITRGVRLTNMTTGQKNAISSPALGLVVYDVTLNKVCVWTGAWQTVTSA